MNYSQILRSIFVLNVFWLLSFHTSAQIPGKVDVVKDPMVDSLISKRLAFNSSSLLSAKGYRVQVFLGDDREKAYSEQAKFRRMYPRLKSYISYEQPNYKILAGNFKTKLEAEKLMNELKPYFSSLFIFSDYINLR